MDNKTLNFCQVSLSRDIPIILQNYQSLKTFYKNIQINIICPKSELNIFKKNLNFDEFYFFCEEDLISFGKFTNIFSQIPAKPFFKDEMKNRLQWYYQQVLKITFVINFIKNNNTTIIIWDADTIITKKINFLENKLSYKYGTLFEYHKKYFQTAESILGLLPRYYISSLIQFLCVTKKECDFFLKILGINNTKNNDIPKILSNIILNNIIKTHNVYSGSLFSEYELIGISNLLNKNTKQQAIFTLRSGLDGQLTKKQFFIAKLLNVYHVTYEHTHLNVNSKNMLARDQKWFNFLKILIKFYPRFLLKNIIHNFKFFFDFSRWGR